MRGADRTIAPSTEVTVRYWAGARDAAGCREETVEPAPLSVLLERLAERHGLGLKRIIAGSVVLVDGIKTERAASQAVTAGGLVEVLPPFAGG
jgi:molybdopterin converting factor small subunit